MKEFKGKVLFLDRSDINTDEIIPAKYLTTVNKEELKSHLLEDLKLQGFDPQTSIKGKQVVITRSNFGCGSSREHAPWAFEVNGINVIIAINFARIFRQNMFNCGMLAIELPESVINEIFDLFSKRDTYLEVDVDNNLITIKADNLIKNYTFQISSYDKELIKAGGWVEYADKKY